MLTKKLIYSCDDKAEFSASLLQSSVSHDPTVELLNVFMFDTVVLFSGFCDG